MPQQSKPLAAYIETLYRVYSNFWEEVVKLTGGLAKPISRDDLLIKVTSDESHAEHLKVETKTAFWIEGLPGRRKIGASKQSYDVVIGFEQLLSVISENSVDSQFEAEKSVVRLMYLDCERELNRRQQENGQEIVRHVYVGVHFDLLDQKRQTLDEYDHPVYHANFDMRCFDLSKLDRNSYRIPEGLQRIDALRIPTAPMDISAVVFSVLRDHLPDKVDDGWSRKMRSRVDALPRYPKGALANYTGNAVFPNCLCWYKTDGTRDNYHSAR